MKEGYIQLLRKKIGTALIIHPAARILIENGAGEYLFIRRTDNEQWGIPAGALEKGETIEECIRREVLEETGLKLRNLQVIGISTRPSFETVEYPNGDQVQYFTIEFYSNDYEGIPIVNDQETSWVGFRPSEQAASLPKNEQLIFESWRYYQQTGQIFLQ